MADGNILSDFGIDLLEEEIDDVIFQTNEFLTDATFTGSQGPFWWILQMCMALAALFAIVMAAGMAYKMMVKHEPLDVMKLFRPLAVSLILCWWYPPADTGMANSGSNWCFLDFLSYIPNCVGSYTHDLYEAEASQISDKFEEVQELIYVRDTMYTALQAQADVAHTGTSDPNLIEATMEQTGVDEVTNMEKDAAKLWFTSLTSGVIVGIDKIIILIALVVFRIGWWATIYCQQILLGMLTIFGHGSTGTYILTGSHTVEINIIFIFYSQSRTITEHGFRMVLLGFCTKKCSQIVLSKSFAISHGIGPYPIQSFVG